MHSARERKILNGLVQDELAAVETYRQALDKVADDPAGDELRRIEIEHEDAVNLLQEGVAEMGEEPATTSGVWGAWSKAVEGTAKLFGNKAAIKALKEGEEHGIGDYERALREDGLDPRIKALISTSLLPRTRAHLPVLDRFIQSGGDGAAPNR